MQSAKHVYIPNKDNEMNEFKNNEMRQNLIKKDSKHKPPMKILSHQLPERIPADTPASFNINGICYEKRLFLKMYTLSILKRLKT